MRIGFDAKRYFENKTGLGCFSRNLIIALITNYPDNQYFLYTSVKPTDKHISNLLDTSKVKIRYPKKTQKHYWRSRGILKELINDKIDVYHGLSNEIPFGIHKTSIKSVVTIHDLLFKTFRKDFKLVDRLVSDIKSKYACRNADRLVAISEKTKDSIVDIYNINSEKISVIYQDIDPIFREPLDQDYEKKILKTLNIPIEYMLFVGNDSERKNLITLIRSLVSMKEKPNLVLILSKKVINKNIQKIIDSNKISNQIMVLTNIHINTLKVLYKNAKCLIYPSLGEGWGLPPAEALACKTPAIVPNTNPFKEQFSDGKIYLKDPKDPFELAVQIEAIWSKKKIIFNEFSFYNSSDLKYQLIYKSSLIA